jgi:hypothetical protein
MPKSSILIGLSLLFCSATWAQDPYRVAGRKAFNARDAVLEGALEDGDRLGSSFAPLGSSPTGPGGLLMAAGLRGVDVPGRPNSGEVWLINIRPNGNSQRVGRFGAADIPELSAMAGLGDAMAGLGDLDGDGISELAVSAPFDLVAGLTDLGSVYICYLSAEGELKRYRRITNGSGGLSTSFISPESRFGTAVASVGDLNGDGTPDLAVSAPADNIGGIPTGGAVYLLFLDTAGMVIQTRTINALTPPLVGRIANSDLFGSSLAWLGDLDGSGSGGYLAVGSPEADDRGRVHLLKLSSTGDVLLNREIRSDLPSLSGLLDGGDLFGYALANIGDLNGDGLPDLAVSAPGDDDSEDGGPNKGAVYLLYLREDGFPQYVSKISETSGNLGIDLSPSDFFASAVASPGDVDSDGLPDLIIGARNKSVDGERTGIFYLLKQAFCRPPGNPTASIESATSLTLSWSESPGASGYVLQTRIQGSSGWNTQTVFSSALNIDTLEPGETYDWRVFTGCGSLTSFFTERLSVTMPSERSAGLSAQYRPGSRTLIWQLDDAPEGQGELRLWASDGRLIHAQALTVSGGMESGSAQLERELAPGLYLLEWNHLHQERLLIPLPVSGH